MKPGAKRIAVIGGGAVGVCTASWLLREGHAVTLIEGQGIGKGASFGNAGCLNPSSVVPMSMPGVLKKVPGYLLDPLGPLSIRWSYLPTLAPWLRRFVAAGTKPRVTAQAKALKALLDDSYGRYWPLVKDAGAEALVRRQGHLCVYRSRADFAGDALGWQLRRDNGIPLTVLEDDALWQSEPALSRDYRIGVFMEENGHTTNPLALVTALAEAFVAQGGRIVTATAHNFAFEGDRLRGVGTSGGLVEAEGAVVAAGARSKAFAAELGDDVPLDTERGYHVLLDQPAVMPRVPVMDAGAKFVATPMDTGLRLAGTVEFAGLEAAPDWRRAHMLETLGARLFPALQAPRVPNARSVWMGFRPSLPDSLPVIGPARRSPQVVYAFGHGHVGLAAAAATGRVVADLLSGKPPAFDITPFSATRF